MDESNERMIMRDAAGVWNLPLEVEWKKIPEEPAIPLRALEPRPLPDPMRGIK